jgi:hypothetical protein
MKKLLLLAMALGLFVELPNICHAQSAKEAVRALQKLQARIEIGISYRDYSPALGDAKFEVNLYMQGREAKTKLELATSLSKVIDLYQAALDVWKYGVANDGPIAAINLPVPEVNGEYPKSDWYGNEYAVAISKAMFKVCPRLKNEVTPCPGCKNGQSVLNVLTAIHILWDEAAKELEKAMKLLSQ